MDDRRARSSAQRGLYEVEKGTSLYAQMSVLTSIMAKLVKNRAHQASPQQVCYTEPQDVVEDVNFSQYPANRRQYQ